MLHWAGLGSMAPTRSTVNSTTVLLFWSYHVF